MHRPRKIKEFIDPDPPTFSYGWHATSVIFAYAFGLIATSITLYTTMGAVAFFIFLLGIVCALPVLGLTLIVLVFFKDNIEQNPEPWCIAAPIIIPACWALFDIFVLGGSTNEPKPISTTILPLYGKYDLLSRVGFAVMATGFSAFYYRRLLSDRMRKAYHARFKEYLEKQEENEHKEFIEKIKSRNNKIKDI